MDKPLTTGEKIARDLCEMEPPIDNIIEVDPTDVARRIDEEVFSVLNQLTAEQSKVKELEAEKARLLGQVDTQTRGRELYETAYKQQYDELSTEQSKVKVLTDAIDAHLNPCGCANGCEFCKTKMTLEEALATVKDQ